MSTSDDGYELYRVAYTFAGVIIDYEGWTLRLDVKAACPSMVGPHGWLIDAWRPVAAVSRSQFSKRTFLNNKNTQRLNSTSNRISCASTSNDGYELHRIAYTFAGVIKYLPLAVIRNR